MKRKQGHILTAVLVDYDNIYLALRRKSEEAAKRFAKDAGSWLKEIETSGLITPTNGLFSEQPRRIVLNRCYGNPVPRRNTHDNSTDMFSFPFVRHHFLRSGFEVVDCPPLTAQLKNSSDIRMVMDVRDLLLHDTYFDEFIIMSGDADFTPVLHRLRAHARRTVIFANDHTAVPYKAISDGEVRESDLIAMLLGDAQKAEQPDVTAEPPRLQIEDQRRAIAAEALAAVTASSHPIPIDLLAERVVRLLGHDSTLGSGWAGAGSLRELLTRALPDSIRIGEQPPYYVMDLRRQVSETPRRAEIAAPATRLTPTQDPAPTLAQANAAAEPPMQQQSLPQQQPEPAIQAAPAPRYEQAVPSQVAVAQAPALQVPLAQAPLMHAQPTQAPYLQVPAAAPPMAPVEPQQAGQYGGMATGYMRAPQQAVMAQPAPSYAEPAPPQQVPQQQQLQAAVPQYQPTYAPAQPVAQHHGQQQGMPIPRPQQHGAPASALPQRQASPPDATTAATLQQSIARIHEACQAPPLSPPEYRTLFDVMAREIMERGLAGSQTLTNIAQRAQEQGVEVRRDDVRFILEVVSETDPWFEQGASPSLFAGRFRNFVVARCRSQGLNLSADELDLIEAWFVSGAPAPSARTMPAPGFPASADPRQAPQQARAPQPAYAQPQSQLTAGLPLGQAAAGGDEEFPRIVRTRLRG